MSLDVYLTMENTQPARTGSGIFVREDGQTKEITRAEWDAKFPNREPIVVSYDPDSDTVYSANITHNLGSMAGAAGIYKHLWRPEEIDIIRARQLIQPLRDGLAWLQSNPERAKELNPNNGWGTYEGLMQFVAKYLHACEEYPDALVSVSR